jgi:hypothetical protein
MNEVELIRAQLAAERQHAAEVSQACVSALWAAVSAGGESLTELQPFRQASVEYLVWVLARFEERDQVFRDLVHSRFGVDDPTRRTVDKTLSLAGSSRDVLAKFEAALASTTGSPAASSAGTDPNWDEFLQFFSGAWSARREQLDSLLERQATVADWRAVAAIDADSIFEERSRYARVRATLPAGVEMPTIPRV